MICNHSGRISTALKFAPLCSILLKRLSGTNLQSSKAVSISLLFLGAGIFHQHIPKSKRDIIWRADSVSSDSETHTSTADCLTARRAEECPVQYRCSLAPVSLNLVSKFRNSPFTVPLGTLQFGFPSCCGPLQVATGLPVG